MNLCNKKASPIFLNSIGDDTMANDIYILYVTIYEIFMVIYNKTSAYLSIVKRLGGCIDIILNFKNKSPIDMKHNSNPWN